MNEALACLLAANRGPNLFADDDDNERVCFNVALSPKTARTRNKLTITVNSRRSQCNETFLVRLRTAFLSSVCCGKIATMEMTGLTPADCSRPMQQSLERCGRQW